MPYDTCGRHHRGEASAGGSREVTITWGTHDHGRLRWYVGVALAVGLLAGIYVTACGLQLRFASGDLRAARDAASRSQDALSAGDVDTAADALAAATTDFDTAHRRLGGPLLAPVRALPLARANLTFLRDAAAAGAELARAAADVLDVVRDAPGNVTAFAPAGGAIPIDRIGDLAVPLRRLADRAESAHRRLSATFDAPLLAPVEQAGAELIERLARLAPAARRGAAATAAIPDLLGGPATKRYFFAASNPAELRGSGGIIGAYAIATVTGGRIEFGAFQAPMRLGNVDHDELEAPNADYATRYDDYGGAGFWQNINMTPDFPSAALAIATLYEHRTGEQVDGVILVDPVALQGLARITGPVDIPEVGRVSADDLVTTLAVESFDDFEDHAERKDTLGAVAAGVLQKFLQGATMDLTDMVELGQAMSGGHLTVHARDSGLQQRLLEAGLAGELYQGGDSYVGFVAVNAAANKLDYFTDRTIDAHAQLAEDGSAQITARLLLDNTAPSAGLPKYAIGPNAGDLVAGENATLVNAYCGRSCAFHRFRRDGQPSPVHAERELGHKVFWSYERLVSGEHRELTYDWRVSDAWTWGRYHGTYRIVIDEQALLRPTRLRLRIDLPPDFVVTGGSAGMRVVGGAAVWDREVNGRATYEVTFRRPGSLVRQALVNWWRAPLLGD